MLILNKIRKPYLLLLLLPLGLATNSHLFAAARTVTHAGSHGIDNQVFRAATGGTNGTCSGCHEGWTDYDWTVYADANTKAALIVTRINLSPGDAGFMPDGGNTQLSATLRNLVNSWVSASKPRWDSPYIAQGSSSAPVRQGTNNYSAAVSFAVNDNGAESTYTTHYEIIGSLDDNTVSATDDAAKSGGGGNVASSNDTASATLTNLVCGSQYTYWLYGNNAAVSGVSGATASDTTSTTNTISAITCNTGASISGTAPAATEDSAYSWTPTKTAGTGTDTLTYSFSVAPTGSNPKPVINSSTGQITWTPVEGQTSSSFTIQVSDAAADTSITDTLAVTVNVSPIIDNDPVITTIQANLLGASENALYQHDFQLSDADVNGDSWTWTLPAKDDPDIGINASSGLVSWTPAEGEAGDYDITVRVTDSDGRFDEGIFTISVSADNEAPLISNQPIADGTATEGIAYSLNLDATDTDSPDTQTWSIQSPAVLPDNMAINGSGVLSWTPGEGIDRTQSVTIRVTDSTSLFDEVSFDIDVTSVNDAPVFDVPIPDDSVEENSAFSYTVDVSDSDPQDNSPDLNSNLTFSITNISPTPDSTPPAIDANGQITWTPGNNDARTVSPSALSQAYVISVSVADSGENGALAATDGFTLTVTLQDADSDTVPDYEDNCVNTSNTNQSNNDADAFGNLCDPDDDNDGISDIAEIFNGLDPYDNSDAGEDLDGDGLTNLAEFNTCTGSDIDSLLTCDNIQIDSVAPIITHSGDEDRVAAGYTTFVDFSATAIDGIDGVVSASSDTDNHHFRPGDNIVTWTAQDAAGNIATEEQYITIHPILSLGGSQVLAEGASGEIYLQFNGDIPVADYPVSINFSVSGTGSPADYILSYNSPIVINDASELINNMLIMDIDILDGDAVEVKESLTITLTGISTGPVLGDSLSHNIQIVDGQVSPLLSLSAEQNAISTQFIFGDQGDVTVTANASDGNNDPLTYDWSDSDAMLDGNASNETFSFDPSLLVIDPADLPQTFKVSAQVSDGISSSTQEILLVYMADTLVLSDSTDSDGDGFMDDIEGLTDLDNDGLPDYLDAYDSPPNILFISNIDTGTLPAFIESSPGTTISMGQFGLATQPITPQFNMRLLENLANEFEDDGFVHFGSIYEFVISGLSDANRKAQVVIPLQQNIPPNAVYRKFNGSNWFTFVEDANNQLSSATSDVNGCPAPNSELYQAGLLPFKDCLQITISDGGPNDIDGLANGTIVDPGGLALPEGSDVLGGTEEEVDESSRFTANGPASSGSLSIWFLLTLSLFYWVSNSTNKKVFAKQ